MDMDECIEEYEKKKFDKVKKGDYRIVEKNLN